MRKMLRKLRPPMDANNEGSETKMSRREFSDADMRDIMRVTASDGCAPDPAPPPIPVAQECGHDAAHFFADGTCTCGQQECADTPYCHKCVSGNPALAAPVAQAGGKLCEHCKKPMYGIGPTGTYWVHQSNGTSRCDALPPVAQGVV